MSVSKNCEEFKMIYCSIIFVLAMSHLLQGVISTEHHKARHDDSVPTVPHMAFAKLDYAANLTACPFEVTKNKNPARWPIEIKEITCTRKLRHTCCDHRYECTQLIDKVVVYSEDRSSNWTETIYVGCVCLKKHHSKPIIPDQPPVVK